MILSLCKQGDFLKLDGRLWRYGRVNMKWDEEASGYKPSSIVLFSCEGKPAEIVPVEKARTLDVTPMTKPEPVSETLF